MNYETLLVEIRERVALITLNRPQALNALNSQLVGELNQALDRLEADPQIGCIVLTGSSKAFAAGADIKELADMTFPQIYHDDHFAAADRIAARRKPVIAAVAGYALGGGCELALMCDFIYAADNARFGLPEITLGVLPGIGGTQRLTRAIGRGGSIRARSDSPSVTDTTGHFPSRVSGSRAITSTGSCMPSAVSRSDRPSIPSSGGCTR